LERIGCIPVDVSSGQGVGVVELDGAVQLEDDVPVSDKRDQVDADEIRTDRGSGGQSERCCQWRRVGWSGAPAE
jgi:hypothetical protein